MMKSTCKRVDGTELTRVTNHPAVDQAPAWLNNETLVFASNRDEGFEIYVVPRTGGSVDRLTVSSGDNADPHAGHK